MYFQCIVFRVAAVSNKDAHQDSTLDGLNCLYFCDTRFCADMEKLLSRNEGIKALVRVALCAEIPSIRRRKGCYRDANHVHHVMFLSSIQFSMYCCID